MSSFSALPSLPREETMTLHRAIVGLDRDNALRRGFLLQRWRAGSASYISLVGQPLVTRELGKLDQCHCNGHVSRFSTAK